MVERIFFASVRQIAINIFKAKDDTGKNRKKIIEDGGGGGGHSRTRVYVEGFDTNN